ncbi:MAG: glycosyltransferase, partial [Cyanobacteria bacterium P01_F01_bin.143]
TIRYYIKQSNRLREEGKLERALSLYQEAIKFHQNPYELYHLGLYLERNLDIDSAIFAYSQALKLEPKNEEFHQRLEAVLAKQSDGSRTEEVIADYEQSLELQPAINWSQDKTSIALFNQGINLIEVGEYQLAFNYFQQIDQISNLQKENIISWPKDKGKNWPWYKFQIKGNFPKLLVREDLPTITVVTCSYNHGKYLEQTILSVINQNYPKLEYIIVDGGSTDNTREILTKYQDYLAKTIIESDDGQANAINKGFRLGTGELMMWLNSDDMLAPGALHIAATTYLQEKCDVIAGICATHRKEEIINIRQPRATQSDFTLDKLADVSRLWCNGHYFIQPEVLFTRKVWEQTGGYLREDLRYVMDYELWMRMAKAEARLKVISWPIAFFRSHESQKTANYDYNIPCMKEHFMVRDEYYELKPSLARIKEITTKIKSLGYLWNINVNSHKDNLPQILIITSERTKKWHNKNLSHVLISSGDNLEQINLESIAVAIIIVEQQEEKEIIQKLKQKDFTGLLVGWFWNNHCCHYKNAAIAELVDVCIPGRETLSESLKNTYSLVTDPVPNLQTIRLELTNRSDQGEEFGINSNKKYVSNNYFLEHSLLAIFEVINNIGNYEKEITLEAKQQLATQIKSNIANNEGNNIFPNLSNEDYIQYLYKALLNRKVGSKAFESKLKGLNNNITRTSLIEEILLSQEFTTLNSSKLILQDMDNRQFLQVFWSLLLGRRCGSNEEKHNLSNLNKGLSRYKLIYSILNSQEFKDRVENLGLLSETITKNSGNVWIMGTDKFINQEEWDLKLLNVLSKRLSRREDIVYSSKLQATSNIVKQYLALNRNPLVSVITSLFKGGEFIENFLENITNQTIFEGIELIIIDANSPENEYEIIEKYSRKFKNIKYIRTEKTIGIYDAWNIGVLQARGEFLTNANLDDLRRFDCLEKQAEALLQNPNVDLVYQDIFYSLTSNLPFEIIEDCAYKTNLPEVATRENMLKFNLPHNAPMWRRHIHDAIGLFNSNYKSAGDYELWMRALLAGIKMLKIKDTIAIYYNNPNGISTRKDSKGAYEAKEIQTIYQSLFNGSLMSIKAEDFITFYRQHFETLKNINNTEVSTETWIEKITFLDQCFIKKLREISKEKFYLQLNN